MGAKIVYSYPKNEKQSCPKIDLYSLLEILWFPCNPLYDSKNEGRPTKSVVGCFLSWNTKLDFKLKFRHRSFF